MQAHEASNVEFEEESGVQATHEPPLKQPKTSKKASVKPEKTKLKRVGSVSSQQDEAQPLGGSLTDPSYTYSTSHHPPKKKKAKMCLD